MFCRLLFYVFLKQKNYQFISLSIISKISYHKYLFVIISIISYLRLYFEYFSEFYLRVDHS